MKENPNFTVPPYDPGLPAWGLVTRSLSVLAKQGQVETVKNLLQNAQDASSLWFLRKKQGQDDEQKEPQKKPWLEVK